MKQNNLNKIRIQKGLTQQDIADATKISRSHIQTIEYYKVSPNVHAALRIADFLQVDINELFYN